MMLALKHLNNSQLFVFPVILPFLWYQHFAYCLEVSITLSPETTMMVVPGFY